MFEDSELLRRYAMEEDEEAFGELVQRHVGLVYSAALRQVRDAHLAEDITQTVFLKLARKAKALPEGVVLAGWLHSDTRFTSLEVLRKERRRAAREAIPMEANDENNWNELQPVIDEALAGLDTTERDAVLLRFFGDRSFAEIGAALRLAPDAARMRMNRALDKLREALEKQGIKTTAAALSAALMANLVQAAPQHTAARIMSSLPGITSATVTPFWLSKGAIGGAAVAGIAAMVLFLLWRNLTRPTPERAAPQMAQLSAPTLQAALAAEVPPATHATAELDGTKKLRLKVVEGASGAALGNVEVKWSTFTDVLKSRVVTLHTAEDGTVALSFPTEHQRDFYFRGHLSKDGYVPRYVSWSVYQRDQIEDIPQEYTATMDRGIEIGGVVRDANGQPIPDVKLVFTGRSPVGVDARERDTVMGNYHTETTDSNGQWRCNHVRPDFATTTFRLEHRFFRGVTYGCKETDHPSIGPILLPSADYLARQADMRMERGIIVSGVVVDEMGRAIEGATVGRNREWNPKERLRVTGANGEFAFHDAEPGEVIITVQAQGFAPQTKTPRLEDQEVKLTFQLQRSVGLRGRVVDQNGAPVLRADISTAQDDRYRKLYRWSAQTDASGAFYWDSSPNQALELAIFAYGFGHTNATVQPGNEVQTITLSSRGENKAVAITIRAIDRETKQPVENAGLHVVENDGGGSSPFQGGRTPVNGIFKFVTRSSDAVYAFEVRAPGYLPARTNLARVTEPQEIELALEKSQAISGTVLSPNGDEIAGASVALCTGEAGALLSRERRLVFMDQSHVVLTDGKGRFQHEPRVGAHTLYVVDQSGFAAVRLGNWQSGNTIQLKPWGRIQGIATISGQAAKNIELGLLSSSPNGNERWLDLYDFKTVTDNEGQFVFENVPPLEVKLSWMRAIGRGKAYSHSMAVDIQAGVTSEVVYLLAGGTVRGRLKFDGNVEVDWPEQARSAHLNVQMGSPSYERYRDNPELLKKAFNEFWAGEEGRNWERKRKSFALEIRKDGTFEVPAVPPGEYLLRVYIQEKGNRPFPPGRSIARLEQAVSVPDGTTELDIGEVLVRGR